MRNTIILDTLQAIQNEKNGWFTTNAYSNDVRQSAVTQYEQELDKLDKESLTLFHNARKARAELEAKLDAAHAQLPLLAVSNGWDDATATQYWAKYEREMKEPHEDKYHWRNREIGIRLQAIRDRLEQLHNSNMPYTLVDRCIDMEKQVDGFIAKIRSMSSNSGYTSANTVNHSIFAPFN